jgi:hypothetical protein
MTANPAGATDARFNEEGDWIARESFSQADLKLSPEEYAARNAHLWGCFSLHLYRYRDPSLGAWVRRLSEILSTEGEVERCRQRFLTPKELADVRRQASEGF